MAQRKNTTPNPPPGTMLTIGKVEFKDRLTKRIGIGDELFNRMIQNQKDFEKLKSEYELWDEYNSEMLKQVFNNPSNEYLESYDHAGYTFLGGQMGEVQNNPVQTKKNLIDYKLKNLKSRA